MSYSPLSISASAQSFATLKTEGARGYLTGLLTAQSGATAAQKSLAQALMKTNQAAAPMQRFKEIVDIYLNGNPGSIADIESALVDLQFAYQSVATAIAEIGVLVDANQGYSATAGTTTGAGVGFTHRVWS